MNQHKMSQEDEDQVQARAHQSPRMYSQEGGKSLLNPLGAAHQEDPNHGRQATKEEVNPYNPMNYAAKEGQQQQQEPMDCT